MHNSRIPFTTIRIEGAILPPDLLQRIADGDAGLEARSVSPESYHLAKGEKINEAINRAWNRALGAWAAFRDASAKLADTDPGTTLTRERWLLPLFAELGYGRLATAKAIEIAGDAYPISHGWQNTPIHLVGCHVDLDARTKGVAGAARNSPHSLVQILLNRSDAHLWAFVSNGLRLRVLRDNKMLTRQAFVEFDLQAMMDGQVYSDFVLLWLVCHQSRVEELGIGNRESGVGKTTAHSPLPTPYPQLPNPADCWLEKWSRAAAEQGTRALDQLRGGVENAISALGRGFLAHPANRNLRDKLYTGKLDAQDYYRQLLRLVYRLIFLFVAEDRGLLFVPNADANTRDIFARFYSTAKLRALAERRRGTRHADLYHGLRLVMELLGGEMGNRESGVDNSLLPTAHSLLGLPILGGFLFSAQAIPDLSACEIANHDLLDAIRALAFTMDRNARRVVDYKNLGSEELGSVYESLLELHPIINADAAQHSAAATSFELKTASGNERKTTGSFYTPTPLINVLLDSALDPVIESAIKGVGSRESGVDDSPLPTPHSLHSPLPTAYSQERALLSLKVCDSAGGSGHIAIAAARRIAKRLATIRTGDEEPSPEAMRTALRDVITHCIYVVDVNPMAIELCKVNLWMEMQDPRYPLSFLDAHIKCGNALVGVGRWGVEDGESGMGNRQSAILESLLTTPYLPIPLVIPDEAFNPVTGDHKPTASALKKRNKGERTSGQLPLMVTVLESLDDLQRWVTERARQLNAMPEDDATEVQAKSEAYRQLTESENYARRKLEYDLWTAAFFWKIEAVGSGEWAVVAPTQSELAKLRRGEKLNPDLVRQVQALAERLRFFHWELEFPEVWGDRESGVGSSATPHSPLPTPNSLPSTPHNGFDVKLMNPPWERIKLQEEEFFAARDPGIANAPNKAARQKLIDALPKKNPALAREFEDAKHDAEATSKFVRESKRFPLTAVGDVNTYALFAEHARTLLNANGRAGIILPTGIATDDATKDFFANLIEKHSLASLYDFENREAIFQGVHRSYKFCLLTMSGNQENRIDFVFFATRVEHLRDKQRQFILASDEIALFNPNTRTCPVFRTRADADLTKKIYRKVPVFVNERTSENVWQTVYRQGLFHSSTDADAFNANTLKVISERGGVQTGNHFILSDQRYLPLYESRMIWQFDHRSGSYESRGDDRGYRVLPETSLTKYQDPNYAVLPFYWVLQSEVDERLQNKWQRKWLLGFRDITAATLERSVVFSFLPYAGISDQFGLLFLSEEITVPHICCLAANFNSLTLDFIARQKIGGLHLKKYLLYQLPVLPPTAYTPADIEFIAPRVLELVYTAWDMKPFAQDLWESEVGSRESGVGNRESATAHSPLPTPNLRNLIIKQWEANSGQSIREILPGFESVARGNDAGGTMLSADQSISEGRDLRNDLADSQSGGISPSEHRGGVRSGESRGLRSVSSDRPGFTQGSGDTPDSISAGETNDSGSRRANSETLRDGRENVAGVDSGVTREPGVGSGESAIPESLLTTAHLPIPPFLWNDERRAHLRAELDAYYARLYGLTRDELRYILDPKDVYGDDFPGETFRVLKDKEIKQYGEYRTRRLVLEKWDEQQAKS